MLERCLHRCLCSNRLQLAPCGRSAVKAALVYIFFIAAAVLEVAGDAVIRKGMRASCSSWPASRCSGRTALS